jgi:hypothetical protein
VRAVLETSPDEVQYLLEALRAGRVDGSAYEGECCCLVGTLARGRGVGYRSIPGLEPDSNRPAERWFTGISAGNVPATNQVAAITQRWIAEWLAERAEGLPSNPSSYHLG